MTERLDDAIDRAVRDMLDVEPRADLQARVMAQLPAAGSQRPAPGSRLTASGFPRNRAFGRRGVLTGGSRTAPALRWIVVPLAAAALIVLAVFVARRSEPLPQRPVVARAGDQHLASEGAPAPLPRVPSPERHVAPAQRATREAVAPRGRVVATAVSEDTTLMTIAALPGPASIDVGRLQAPAESTLPSIAPEQMVVRALEVTALPELPRERHEE